MVLRHRGWRTLARTEIEAVACTVHSSECNCWSGRRREECIDWSEAPSSFCIHRSFCQLKPRWLPRPGHFLPAMHMAHAASRQQSAELVLRTITDITSSLRGVVVRCVDEARALDEGSVRATPPHQEDVSIPFADATKMAPMNSRLICQHGTY